MTPIERASRASFEVRADWNYDDYKWDNATTIEQNAEYASVKAAISALLPPSEAMVRAAISAVGSDFDTEAARQMNPNAYRMAKSRILQ